MRSTNIVEDNLLCSKRNDLNVNTIPKHPYRHTQNVWPRKWPWASRGDTKLNIVKNSHNTSSCIRAMSQIYPWNLLLPHSSCCFYHRVLLILCSSTAVHLPWQHLSPGRLQALINQCLCIYSASYNLLPHFIQSDLLKIQFYSHVNSLHYLHWF